MKLKQERALLAQKYEDEVANLRYIMDPEEAREILTQLGDKVCALDFETTGLDPNYARVRLSCIYHPDHGAIILDHDYCGAFKDLCKHMLEPFWLVYNAKFEIRWFDHYVRNRVDLFDIDFLYKARKGGTYSSLAFIVRQVLGIVLDKEEQLSDWSKPQLTTGQLQYAARDAVMTYGVYVELATQLGVKQKEAASVFQDAVRATVECEDTGMVLDVDYHQKNIGKWEMKSENAFRCVRRFTNRNVLPNVKSNKQVSDLLKKQLSPDTIAAWPKTEKTKQLSLRRPEIAPIAAKSPYPFSRWLNALILYRYYEKYLSTYGDTLITKQYLEDRITYRLNIGQAATGRFSSSSINIQNIPRAPWVRRAFLPPEGYEYFVAADYSSIEVRVLAELSNDETLRRDVIFGNVHASSASAIYSIDEDEFLAIYDDENHPERPKYSEMRSRAKGFTFQNVYGAAALALSIVLKCSVREAEQALKKWAERYPKAYNYRYKMYDQMTQKGYLPVVDGRTIFVPKADRTVPVASNYGIQGAAASVMLRAMSRMYDLREQYSSPHLIRLCATVHDELILAVKDESQIDHAKEMLTTAMIDGWLDIFPDTITDNLIEAKHGKTWGDAK